MYSSYQLTYHYSNHTPGFQKTFSELFLNEAASPPKQFFKYEGYRSLYGQQGDDHAKNIKEDTGGQNTMLLQDNR